MSTIKIGEKRLEVSGVYSQHYNTRGDVRPVLKIIISGASYASVASDFADGAGLTVIDTDENGVETEFSYNGYCVAGDIVDTRDGKIIVYMGKKTELEVLEEENARLLFENLTGEAFDV